MIMPVRSPATTMQHPNQRLKIQLQESKVDSLSQRITKGPFFAAALNLSDMS